MKPTERLRSTLTEVVSSSNERDHLGKQVRMIRTKYRGLIGNITRMFTAVDTSEKNAKDVGRRGTYYAIELPNTVLVGVNWEEFVQVH